MLPLSLAAAFQADAVPSLGEVGLIGIVLLAVALFGLVTFITSRYKRCPANKVLVISGSFTGGKAAKCISGGGAFVWPVIQEADYLPLEPIQIEVPLRDALSFENIRVGVPSVFTVAIGTEPEVRQNAAVRLLKLDTNQIKQQAQDIIFGQLRQVIASMRIEEINRDRDAFLHNIQQSLEPELRKVGLVLLNVNITDITDESGYIEAIGRKAAAEAVQKARGDVAEEEKIGEIRVATAEQEKLVQVANATKLREIGVREAQRDQAVRMAELEKEQSVGERLAALEREAQVKAAEREQAVRIAELDKEQRVGEQTAAFEKEAQVKEADQLKRIAMADAESRAIAGEAKSQAQIAAARAELRVREAEAYEVAERRQKEAEAAVLEAQNRAMAKAALADAERVEAEKRAEIEAPAKAEKARVIVEAEAEAARRRLEAEAEAAAIYAKLEAEARGQYEILAKKGEGLRAIVEAAGGSEEAFRLLMLEHMDKLAETAAQAISNIKFDKVVVWEGGEGRATSNFLQNMARTMPPMMQVLKDVGGLELPSFLGRMQDEAGAASDGRGAPAAVPVPKVVAEDGVVPSAGRAPAARKSPAPADAGTEDGDDGEA